MNDEPIFSECTACGYKWLTGMSGEHSCVEFLTQRVTALERECQNEQRVIALLVAGGFVKP